MALRLKEVVWKFRFFYKEKIMKSCVSWMAGLLLVMVVSGCNLPTGLPKEFAQVADKLVSMVEDQGGLDDFTSNIDGHIQNPGLETYVAVKTTLGVRIVGVNGEVDLQAAGTGTQGGSPTPLAPKGPSTAGFSTSTVSIMGRSRELGIL